MDKRFVYPYFNVSCICNQSDFDIRTKNALRRESMRIKKSENAICMYSDCNKIEPHHRLECHHIQPERFMGESLSENGILFCCNHHSLADRFLITPEDCLTFKSGEDPYSGLKEESLDELWTKTIMMSEFYPKKTEMTATQIWIELNKIFFAAFNHKDNRNKLCFKICAWILAEKAAFLTAHIPGRNIGDNIKGHNRSVIDEHVAESNKYNLNKDYFLSIHNLHIKAVNYNALLKYRQAENIFRELYKNYGHGNITFETDMPIYHPRYKAYIVRQYALILAKIGDRAAIRLANEGIKLTQSLDCADALSDLNEARTRYLEVSILINDVYNSNLMAEAVTNHYEKLTGIKKVISLKMLAAWALRRGDINDVIYFLEAGLNVAKQNELHHQIRKIQNLYQIIEGDYKRVSFEKGDEGLSLLRYIL